MLRLLFLIMDIPLFCFGRKLSQNQELQIIASLEAGDVILVTDRLFPLWQLAIRLTVQSNYCHSAIYEGGGQVLEATVYYPDGSGVRRTSIYSFISGYKTCCVVRPPYASCSERQNALRYAASQMGKPYDYAMQMTENGSFYCSKLVACALKAANIEVQQSQFAGKKGFAPDDFIKIRNARIVYGNNKNVLPALLAQLFAFAAACLLPAAFAAIFATCIVAAGLWQFYGTPSNSTVKKLFYKKGSIKMKTKNM